jgi:hypothetical protein
MYTRKSRVLANSSGKSILAAIPGNTMMNICIQGKVQSSSRFPEIEKCEEIGLPVDPELKHHNRKGASICG